MYIYNDEDNSPMNDPYYRIFQQEIKDALMQKQEDFLEFILDELELTGKCRRCPYIVELTEGCMDNNGLISDEQFNYLTWMCKVCGGKGTGVIPEDKKKFLDKDWDYRLDWAKENLPSMSCAWCPTAFRIYGKYKDPDDEWNAIDSTDGCANCKYFQEVVK